MGLPALFEDHNKRKWLYSYYDSFDLSDSEGWSDIRHESSPLSLAGAEQEPTTISTIFTFVDVTAMEAQKQRTIVVSSLLSVLLICATLLAALLLANRLVRPALAASEKQKRFIADASHEIKTPVAIIRANYEALLANEEKTIASQQQWLEGMGFGIERLSRLSDNLLNSASIETRAQRRDQEDLEIGTFLRSLIEEFRTVWLAKKIVLSVDIEEGIAVTVDARLLEKALLALLDNAFKFTEEQGKVSVCLKKEDEAICIAIENSGSGILEEDLPHVFEAFYQASKTSSDELSYGLGLSIAQQAIERLGGSIDVLSLPQQQTVFTVRLTGS
ncbi:MAG: HAMP domain-containing histidine kinase [Eggerthellaceae bacterium]|nr:HAMP domain-containing histidine kinase [Eggerthellaceae bacterium]